jgi:hypothetical protein
MTQRNPISSVQNAWFDSEQVGSDQMTTEQNYNNTIQAAIINNHVGQGVLPGNLIQNIIFDSSLVSGLLDGMSILPQNQPSDSSLGNQLKITLTGSEAAGQKTIKIAIIGLDFNSNLQYDTFVFEMNESQYTQKHYTNVLTILFNDFVGTPTQSFNLGGHVVISEAKPFNISRDPIMSSQDIQPNLFFRDFFISGNGTLQSLLLSALPLYNIDNLNIQTGILQNEVISAGDVTTQIGEKFLATTNNIQKITLLLSVQNSASGQATNLVWAGDLVISVYALQSVVDCITDIIPDLPIEFSPYNIPLAQISYNYTTLQAQGITLDGTPQPIDFVFSNTPLATGSAITVNNYYVVTVKRSGAASVCDILIGTGANQSPNSRVTTFAGNNWVDLPTLDLWYQVWTDAVQVSDGQAYESGQGLIIPKTQINPATNTPQDYSLNGITFSGTSNAIYTGVLSSTLQQSGVTQNQITGNPVYSQQQYVPNVELLNVIDLGNLQASSEPLILGTVSDLNIKSTTNTSTILASLYAWTFVGNTIIIKMIDDVTDPRYDLNVLALVSYLTQGAFVNAKIIPDVRGIGINPYLFYRIASAELCTMTYGDVDGDGLITIADVALANQLIGANLNFAPPLYSQITTTAPSNASGFVFSDGYTTSVTNGYVTLTQPFFSTMVNMEWQIVDPVTTNVIACGTDGYLVANPSNGSLANFESPSTNFSTINEETNTGLDGYNLVILDTSNQQNNGAFQILSVNITSNNILDISKLYLTPEVIQQIMRADIDGNFTITSEDGYLIQNYINKVPPFPATDGYSSKIGTPFTVLVITVDPFTYLDPDDSPPTIYNRTDDYPATATNRATTLHATQDIFKNDGYIQGWNFFPSSPNAIPFNIIPQFTWEDYLITCNGNSRFVPTIFSSETGLVIPSCNINGVNCEVYASPPVFDPGRVDVFVPNNLIIGTGGEIVNPDGSNYKVDFEVGTIILEIPEGLYGIETTLNVFDNFVYDYTGTGITRLGFPAMRFADCTTVSSQALVNNQVSFAVAVQSFSPNTNGIDIDGYTGPIVDGKMGVAMDYATGQLTLNFTNLYQDSVMRTLNTKVQVTVFLKKGGFNNLPIFINSTKVANLLNLNNIFTGAGVNTIPIIEPPPVIDLIPISALTEEYAPTAPSAWAGAPPITVQQALDRIAALLDSLPGNPKP